MEPRKELRSASGNPNILNPHLWSAGFQGPVQEGTRAQSYHLSLSQKSMVLPDESKTNN